MTSLVNFKVYLLNQEDPDKQEIRRFGVDQDVVTNFLYLREKILNVFPTLRGKHFTISWKGKKKNKKKIYNFLFSCIIFCKYFKI